MLDSNIKVPKSTSGSPGPITVHKKSSGTGKCQVVPALTVRANVTPSAPAPAISVPALNVRKIFSSPFPLAVDKHVSELYPQAKSGSVDDWNMPPPATRDPRMIRSAPASPTDALYARNFLQEPKEKKGSLGPIPLIRKRSGSLGNGRSVKFAPRPVVREDEEEEESLIAVELGSSGETDPSAFTTPRGRVRSLSCHVLSSSPSIQDCDTIYEEGGPTSNMEE